MWVCVDNVGVEDPHLFHYVDLTLYQGVITPWLNVHKSNETRCMSRFLDDLLIAHEYYSIVANVWFGWWIWKGATTGWGTAGSQWLQCFTLSSHPDWLNLPPLYCVGLFIRKFWIVYYYSHIFQNDICLHNAASFVGFWQLPKHRTDWSIVFFTTIWGLMEWNMHDSVTSPDLVGLLGREDGVKFSNMLASYMPKRPISN